MFSTNAEVRDQAGSLIFFFFLSQHQYTQSYLKEAGNPRSAVFRARRNRRNDCHSLMTERWTWEGDPASGRVMREPRLQLQLHSPPPSFPRFPTEAIQPSPSLLLVRSQSIIFLTHPTFSSLYN